MALSVIFSVSPLFLGDFVGCLDGGLSAGGVWKGLEVWRELNVGFGRTPFLHFFFFFSSSCSLGKPPEYDDRQEGDICDDVTGSPGEGGRQPLHRCRR